MKKIPLTQGKVALVDGCDYEFLLNMAPWSAHYGYGQYYARTTDRRHLLMHRIIMERMNPGFKGEIDHVDRNGLNNQYSNLRIATRSQNQANRKLNENNNSGYKGVHWNQAMNK